jgi:hypothetical protein
MKIFIVCIIAALFLAACVQQQVQPYKSGKYQLKQSYLSATVYGTIYFYNANQFYTTLAGARKDYVFEQKYGRIHATCTGCTSSYIFHVSEVTEAKEKWQANISGSFMTWEITQ